MMRAIDEKTIHITELISGIVILITATILILAGIGAFPFSLESCWLITIFICFFAISSVTAGLQKNHIGIFFSVFWLIMITATALNLAGISLAVIYPLYIIAIPIGLMFATKPNSNIFLISLMIAGACLILFLESAGIVGIGVTLSIVAAYLGALCTIYSAIKLYQDKKTKETNDGA